VVVALALGSREPVARASANALVRVGLALVAVMRDAAGVMSALLVTIGVSGVGVTIVVLPREMRGLLATVLRGGSSATSGLASSALLQSGRPRTRAKRTTAPARTVTIASSTASTRCSSCCARSPVRSIA
jgi:hypothetical protein